MGLYAYMYYIPAIIILTTRDISGLNSYYYYYYYYYYYSLKVINHKCKEM